MTDEAAHRFVFGEIQNVDEIIPARIHKQRMRIAAELLGRNAEELRDGPNLHIAIPQCRDSQLHTDLTVIRRERLLAQHHIDIKGRDGNSSIASWADRVGLVGRNNPSTREQESKQADPSSYHEAYSAERDVGRARPVCRNRLAAARTFLLIRRGKTRGDAGLHDLGVTRTTLRKAAVYGRLECFLRHGAAVNINEHVVGNAVQIYLTNAGDPHQGRDDGPALRRTVLS